MEGLQSTRQLDLFMSLKRDMAMVSGNFYLVLLLRIYLFTQQIYVAEEWAKKAREDLHSEAQSRCAAEKTASDLRQDIDRLSNEVKEAKKVVRARRPALKTPLSRLMICTYSSVSPRRNS